MEIKELKNAISNFNNGTIYGNQNFVSMITIERVFKKKYDEIQTKISDYSHHISTLLGINCEIDLGNNVGTFYIKLPNNLINKGIDHIRISMNSDSFDIYYNKKVKIKTVSKYETLLSNDPYTIDFINSLKSYKKIFKSYIGLHTNLGLFCNLRCFPNEFKILIGDRNHNTKYQLFEDRWNYGLPDYFFMNDRSPLSNVKLFSNINPYSKSNEDIANFYYFKNVITGERKIDYVTPEIVDFINEQLIGKIYTNLTVDISSFDKDLQDELRYYQSAYRSGLEEEKAKEINSIRKLQVDRIMKAYSLFKELTELLNNAKMDLPLERIKIDNINQIIFKNSGIQNEVGYKEFEDFFKNNMILRMLDLSNLDLTDVDIRNMDFSGTNVHINPQTIYNKDMTGVNAIDVHFSPFTDSFDGVILDGALINDYEALIDFNKLKSYNNATVINNEVVSKISK